MQLRDNNNAVSCFVATAIVVFVGCAIVLFGLVSHVDAGILKFGLVAYLFLAVPVLFAAYTGGWTTVNHNSFCMTPQKEMEGKRVKPRLRWLVYARTLIALNAMLGAFLCVIWIGCKFRVFAERGPIALLSLVLFTGTPLLAYVLTHVAFTFASARLDWVTRQEARELLTAGRHWPGTWLEPFDRNRKN